MESIDLNRVRELVDEGGEDLIIELIAIFQTEAPKKIGDIAAAVSKKDGKALHLSAHALKSSSLNIGAQLLARIASQLEKFGEAGNLAEATGLLAGLNAEYKKVQSELKRYSEEHGRLAG